MIPAFGSGSPFTSGISITSPIANTPGWLVASVPGSTATQPWSPSSPDCSTTAGGR